MKHSMEKSYDFGIISSSRSSDCQSMLGWTTIDNSVIDISISTILFDNTVVDHSSPVDMDVFINVAELEA